MSLPISHIVNVQLNVTPTAPSRRDFGIVALFSQEAVAVLQGVYEVLPTQAAVESLFGTNSTIAKATLPFFSQSPRPKQIVIAPWKKDEQTPQQAMAALQEVYSGWYAAAFADELSDAHIEAVGDWVLAQDKKIAAFTTKKADHLNKDLATNPFKILRDKQNHRVLAMYDKNDDHAILSALARALSVNFAANNSTITLKFKQLPGVTADALTLTEVEKCKALGLNYYTYFDQSAMFAEGTVANGRFFDEVHGLDWFVDAVEKEVFTVLFQSASKVPYTDAGTARLMAAVEKVCLEGVSNGLLAPGIWSGDPFGKLNVGQRLESGYYVWADSVDNASSSDRENRKAPPIQVALKLAGAIHSVDVIVNFVR